MLLHPAGFLTLSKINNIMYILYIFYNVMVACQLTPWANTTRSFWSTMTLLILFIFVYFFLILQSTLFCFVVLFESHEFSSFKRSISPQTFVVITPLKHEVLFEKLKCCLRDKNRSRDIDHANVTNFTRQYSDWFHCWRFSLHSRTHANTNW